MWDDIIIWKKLYLYVTLFSFEYFSNSAFYLHDDKILSSNRDINVVVRNLTCLDLINWIL